MIQRLLLLASTCIFVPAGLAGPTAAPPAFPPGTVQDTYFGTVVADPFRTLEDVKNPEVARWMRAQADYTRATLDAIAGRAPLYRRIRRYDDAVAARVAEVRRRPGELYFYEKRGARDNQFKLYVRTGLKGRERLLVDPEALHKKTGVPHAINYFEPSPSGKYVAYGLSAGGSEDADLFVIEVAGGRTIIGPVTRAQFGGVAWLADDSGFFFNRLQELKPGTAQVEKFQKSRALFLRLGTDVEQAPTALAFDSPAVAIDPAEDAPFVAPIPDTDLALGQVQHGTAREVTLFIAPLADAIAGRAQWRKVIDRSDDVTQFETIGTRLFVLTHRNASRFRLLETSLAAPDLAQAREVIAQSDGVLTGLARAADGLYVRRRDGAASTLWRLDKTPGAQAAPVRLPLAGSFELAGVDHRLPGVWVMLQSWVREPQLYAVTGARVRNTGLQPATKYGALTDYVATEVRVPGRDGARVPLSIIHKKGVALDGRNPTLLYGYASYGITEEPWFSLWRLAWLERGGIFAVANPRGSGAFGEDWYKAGFQANKPNSWKDFIAAAEYLVARKYTSPAKLAIWGGSAGGILVGRSMTERPDLFAAVVVSVGALDMVRTELTANGVPNIPEFGSHKTEPGFRALLEMSTYHQIRDGVKYPAVLFTHGVNDPRVDVWETTKTGARLLQASASGKPVLLRLDYASGHGIGDTKEQRNQERTDILSFLLWQFGVAAFQPR